MTDRELAATILMIGAESKDLKGKEAKELLTQVEQEITKHTENKLKNGVLHSVSDCKNLNIHECLNDLEKVIEVKIGVLAFIDKGSLRYQLKKAIDKMICCR